MKIIVAIYLLCSVSSALGYDANAESIKQCQAALKPAIIHIEKFISEHHHLPNSKEFNPSAWETNRTIILIDRSNKYAVKQGARTNLDFMLGAWRGERFYYYKSWDKGFVDAWDENEVNAEQGAAANP